MRGWMWAIVREKPSMAVRLRRRREQRVARPHAGPGEGEAENAENGRDVPLWSHSPFCGGCAIATCPQRQRRNSRAKHVSSTFKFRPPLFYIIPLPSMSAAQRVQQHPLYIQAQTRLAYHVGQLDKEVCFLFSPQLLISLHPAQQISCIDAPRETHSGPKTLHCHRRRCPPCIPTPSKFHCGTRLQPCRLRYPRLPVLQSHWGSILQWQCSMAHILDHFRLFQFRRKFRPPRGPLLLLLVLPGQDHLSPLATAARFPSKLSYPRIIAIN